jgi:cytochrome c-type biogenesis protein CcmE
MTPRQRRLTLVIGILAGVSIATALAVNAFRDNVTGYFVPGDVIAGKVRPGEAFKMGGMVVKGSVQRAPGSLEVHFTVTDGEEHNVPVRYTGVLPDLFREGTGVVARGQLRADGTFVAEEVLAKHDENYMPPNVGMKKRPGESRADSTAVPTHAPTGS